jgi:hypothetical protein
MHPLPGVEESPQLPQSGGNQPGPPPVDLLRTCSSEKAGFRADHGGDLPRSSRAPQLSATSSPWRSSGSEPGAVILTGQEGHGGGEPVSARWSCPDFVDTELGRRMARKESTNGEGAQAVQRGVQA